MEIDKSQCLCWSQPLVRAAQGEHGRGRKAHVEPEGSSSSSWSQVANCTPCLYWKILSLFFKPYYWSTIVSVLYRFLLYGRVSQLDQYTHPLSFEPPPTHPCLLPWSIRERWVVLPVSYSGFSRQLFYVWLCVHFSVTLPVCTTLPFLPCGKSCLEGRSDQNVCMANLQASHLLGL